MLDSKTHNYEHGGKVWFYTNEHPMQPAVPCSNYSTQNAKLSPKRPLNLYVDRFDKWQLMELAAMPESSLPYGQYMFFGTPNPPKGWITV